MYGTTKSFINICNTIVKLIYMVMYLITLTTNIRPDYAISYDAMYDCILPYSAKV